MQKEQMNTDRCLDGKERENERINIKRVEIQIKKLGLEIDQANNQIDSINLEIEAKLKNIEELKVRVSQGKKLINGAKLKDVLAQAKPEAKTVKHVHDNPLKNKSHELTTEKIELDGKEIKSKAELKTVSAEECEKKIANGEVQADCAPEDAK